MTDDVERKAPRVTAQVISAVPTPFTPEGDLDPGELERLLERIDKHVGSALIAGTTAEFPALDDEERVELFRVAVDVLGADRTIAHVGHASTRQVLRLAEQAAGLGISRLALLSPYYLPTDDEGVVRFFGALTERYPEADVYAYLFPERTGMDVSPETLAAVMALPGVRGVKLSGRAAADVPAYAAVLQDDQELFSGDDSTLPQVMAAGGAGVVSGVSTAFPETFAQLVAALDAGRADAVESAQARAREVVGLTGATISRLKLALAARTGSHWAHRMALPAIEDALAVRIRDAVERYG